MGLRDYVGPLCTAASLALLGAVILAYVANPVQALRDLALVAVGAVAGFITASNKRSVIETPPGAKVKCTCDIEG